MSIIFSWSRLYFYEVDFIRLVHSLSAHKERHAEEGYFRKGNSVICLLVFRKNLGTNNEAQVSKPNLKLLSSVVTPDPIMARQKDSPWTNVICAHQRQ